MLRTAIFVLVLFFVPDATSSFSNDIINSNAKSFSKAGGWTRVKFCEKADVSNLDYFAIESLPVKTLRKYSKVNFETDCTAVTKSSGTQPHFFRVRSHKQTTKMSNLGKVIFLGLLSKTSLEHRPFPKNRCENKDEKTCGNVWMRFHTTIKCLMQPSHLWRLYLTTKYSSELRHV